MEYIWMIGLLFTVGVLIGGKGEEKTPFSMFVAVVLALFIWPCILGILYGDSLND